MQKDRLVGYLEIFHAGEQYEDSDGSLIRLTRENFPSQEEFLRFKAWSDENYHDVERECHAYRRI